MLLRLLLLLLGKVLLQRLLLLLLQLLLLWRLYLLLLCCLLLLLRLLLLPLRLRLLQRSRRGGRCRGSPLRRMLAGAKFLARQGPSPWACRRRLSVQSVVLLAVDLEGPGANLKVSARVQVRLLEEALRLVEARDLRLAERGGLDGDLGGDAPDCDVALRDT